MIRPEQYLDLDRERGVLTSSDREYLIGKNEPESSQVDSNIRNRIRDRTRNAILDFWLINSHLDEKDRRMIFAPSKKDDNEVRELEDFQFRQGLTSLIGFLYEGLSESGTLDFEEVIESGIHEIIQDNYQGPVVVDVRLHVDVDTEYDLDEARRKFNQGEPMTPSEIGGLLMTGEVESGEEVLSLASYARDMGVVEVSLSKEYDELLEAISDEDMENMVINPMSQSRLQREIVDITEDRPEDVQQAHEQIEQMELGPGDRSEELRMAVRVAYDYIWKNQGAPSDEIVDMLYSTYSGGYENPNAWWHDSIGPALLNLPSITANSSERDDQASGGDSTYPN